MSVCLQVSRFCGEVWKSDFGHENGEYAVGLTGADDDG